MFNIDKVENFLRRRLEDECQVDGGINWYANTTTAYGAGYGRLEFKDVLTCVKKFVNSTLLDADIILENGCTMKGGTLFVYHPDFDDECIAVRFTQSQNPDRRSFPFFAIWLRTEGISSKGFEK